MENPSAACRSSGILSYTLPIRYSWLRL